MQAFLGQPVHLQNFSQTIYLLLLHKNEFCLQIEMKPMRSDINDCFFQTRSVDPPDETGGGETFPQKGKEGKNVLMFLMNTFKYCLWSCSNSINVNFFACLIQKLQRR